jgi:hypothetical protein
MSGTRAPLKRNQRSHRLPISTSASESSSPAFATEARSPEQDTEGRPDYEVRRTDLRARKKPARPSVQSAQEHGSGTVTN